MRESSGWLDPPGLRGLQRSARAIDQVGNGRMEVQTRVGNVERRRQAMFDIEAVGIDAERAQLDHQTQPERSDEAHRRTWREPAGAKIQRTAKTGVK